LGAGTSAWSVEEFVRACDVVTGVNMMHASKKRMRLPQLLIFSQPFILDLSQDIATRSV
jgi:hypothetical protein